MLNISNILKINIGFLSPGGDDHGKKSHICSKQINISTAGTQDLVVVNISNETGLNNDQEPSNLSFETGIVASTTNVIGNATEAQRQLNSGKMVSRRTCTRPSSMTSSSQRVNSGGANARGSCCDHSITQFAFMDDENISALQQMTKGYGVLTLASQWKSHFDDSEDITDNEWIQEAQVIFANFIM